jgi:hypothetical protein
MAGVACNWLGTLLVLLCVNGLHADYLVGVGELLGGAVLSGMLLWQHCSSSTAAAAAAAFSQCQLHTKVATVSTFTRNLHHASPGKADITGPVADVNLMVSVS